MKYIKLFEKFNVGDYIVYDHDIHADLNGEVVIRKDYPYQITDIDRSGNISYICDDGYQTTEDNNYKARGYKKIPKEEAEILISADKYNI